MFIRVLILVFLLLGFGVASAEPSKPRGFYVVGAAGVSIYDEEEESFGTFDDDEDRSLQLAVGYKILRFLAVEARYTDFGSFSGLFRDLDVSTRTIHVIGIAPFGQSGWEFFGNLGIGKVNVDVSGALDIDEGTLAGGIGFRWYPTPKVAIGIQTDVYVWTEDPDWAAAVGTTQLSLQVIF